jgi:uncharacterized membrane protein HdeD (DUF308 family)
VSGRACFMKERAREGFPHAGYGLAPHGFWTSKLYMPVGGPLETRMSLSGSDLFRGEGPISAEVRRAMNASLAQNWWAIAIRGVAAVVFGVIAVIAPSVTLLSLVIAFSIYAVVDGVMGIVSAVRAARNAETWTFLAAAGIVSVVAGVAALAWPSLTVLLFILLIAAREIVAGGLMIASAMQLEPDHGRGWLALCGVLAFLFGVLLVFAPLLAALVFAW